MINCNCCGVELDPIELKRYDDMPPRGPWGYENPAAVRCAICKNPICNKCMCGAGMFIFHCPDHNFPTLRRKSNPVPPPPGYYLKFPNGREVVLGDFDDINHCKDEDVFQVVAMYKTIEDAEVRRENLEKQYRKAKLPAPELVIVSINDLLLTKDYKLITLIK